MTDVSVVILVGKEELHIRRCLEKLAPLEPRQIFVVESQKGDRTHEIAVETALRLGWRVHDMIQPGADVLVSPRLDNETCVLNLTWHDWPGLYAPQMNAGIEWIAQQANAPKWTIRLDADEYFLPETIDEIKQKIGSLKDDVMGVIFKRRHYIFGGWAKRGTYPVKLLRMWRTGHGKCEERYMDEHIAVDGGRVVEFDGDFVDHNLNSFDWWREKHRGYAKREALDAIEIIAELKSGKAKEILISGQAGEKRRKKYRYYSLPPYFRAVAYFCIRYFLKLGFLDGVTGWRWNFWQGLWYRWIVDREIGRGRE